MQSCRCVCHPVGAYVTLLLRMPPCFCRMSPCCCVCHSVVVVCHSVAFVCHSVFFPRRKSLVVTAPPSPCRPPAAAPPPLLLLPHPPFPRPRPMRRFLHVQRTRCSWMVVDARALHWAHARFVHAQRTGCSWMLVLSHRPMSESYLCCAQDARGCSRSPMRP